MGSRILLHSNTKVFLGVFFCELLFSKINENLMVFVFFFGSFSPHFQIKLSTHGSNFNSMFVSMNELKFILLTGVLDSKLQHCGPCKNSWKKSKTSHLDCSKHIKSNIMPNHEQRKSEKKWKTKILWAKQTFFLATCPSILGQF
jgi:hypothetical protein